MNIEERIEERREYQRKWRANNPNKASLSNKKNRENRKNDRSKMASVLLAKTLNAKKRNTRILEHNLTTAYIQGLLEKQNYCCAFTGIKLDHKTGKDNLRMASIDRIDSKKGYVEKNIQIVLNSMNKAKAASTNKQFHDLIKEIKSLDN